MNVLSLPEIAYIITPYVTRTNKLNQVNRAFREAEINLRLELLKSMNKAYPGWQLDTGLKLLHLYIDISALNHDWDAFMILVSQFVLNSRVSEYNWNVTFEFLEEISYLGTLARINGREDLEEIMYYRYIQPYSEAYLSEYRGLSIFLLDEDTIEVCRYMIPQIYWFWIKESRDIKSLLKDKPILASPPKGYVHPRLTLEAKNNPSFFRKLFAKKELYSRFTTINNVKISYLYNEIAYPKPMFSDDNSIMKILKNELFHSSSIRGLIEQRNMIAYPGSATTAALPICTEVLDALDYNISKNGGNLNRYWTNPTILYLFPQYWEEIEKPFITYASEGIRLARGLGTLDVDGARAIGIALLLALKLPITDDMFG